MTIKADITNSRKYEMDIYVRSMRAMYDNALDQNGEIYDITFNLTDSFANIVPESILTDSRIIKILRYCVAPSISQMKFGQLFGLTSISTFENDRIQLGTPKHKALELLANNMVDFFNKNLDYTRFMWIQSPDMRCSLAFDYAKKWTCSIASDQNAQTTYRNWRKQQQEQALVSKLISLGYVRSSFSGIIEKQTDINIGEYTQEIRVKGRTIQKADLVLRSKKTKKLVLIEAKAVGVELDATKRIKECCDKANDWMSRDSLKDSEIIALIAGFFTESNIANLSASGVTVVWEHHLATIEDVA